MWKPETDNQTLPPEVLPMEGQQKKDYIQEDIKILLGRDCKLEKVMKFYKKRNI